MSAPHQIMPALEADTLAALRVSIEKYGVLMPIVVDSEANIVDGHHRWEIIQDLTNEDDEPEYRVLVVLQMPPPFGLTAENAKTIDDARRAIKNRAIKLVTSRFNLEERSLDYLEIGADEGITDIARTLNLDRRHLSVEQRREIVVELRAGGHSLRSIAGAVGVSKSQVEKDIKKVSTGGHLTETPDLPETVTGTDGKNYPATRPESDTSWEKKYYTWFGKNGPKPNDPHMPLRACVIQICASAPLSRGGWIPVTSGVDDEERHDMVKQLREARTAISRLISNLEAGR